MAEEALATEEEQKPKSKLPLKMILIVAGVLLLEGGVVSMFWVMKGGPDPAEATSPIEGTHEIPSKGLAVELDWAESLVSGVWGLEASSSVTIVLSFLRLAPVLFHSHR